MIYYINIIMFLNIQKIGKTKHKYKSKITFRHRKESALKQNYKGTHLNILNRGSNQIQAVSQPSRKGGSKFKNQQYQIPMTLFFNEEQSTYLPKEVTIKAYQCDESGKEIRKIGTIQLNLAEYATQGKLKMEIQLQPCKKLDAPILTLEIFMQRQADDSKSIDSQSISSDIRKKAEDSQNQQKKNRQKPQSKGYKTSDQSKPKKSFSVKKEYETQISANQNSESPTTKNIDSNSLKKKQDDIESRKYKFNNLPSPSVNKTTRQDKEINKIKGKNSIIEQVQQKESPKKKTVGQKNQQLQFTEGESPQLKVFLLNKQLKQKQADINRLKRQNQSLKKTIIKQTEQFTSNKEKEKQTGIIKQVQDMKKTIISKDITIDQLTTTNKTLSSQQQQYQKTILKLRQQLNSAKEKTSDMKYRQAFFMQSLFENANKEALEEACRFLSI